MKKMKWLLLIVLLASLALGLAACGGDTEPTSPPRFDGFMMAQRWDFKAVATRNLQDIFPFLCGDLFSVDENLHSVFSILRESHQTCIRPGIYRSVCKSLD